MAWHTTATKLLACLALWCCGFGTWLILVAATTMFGAPFAIARLCIYLISRVDPRLRIGIKAAGFLFIEELEIVLEGLPFSDDHSLSITIKAKSISLHIFQRSFLECRIVGLDVIARHCSIAADSDSRPRIPSTPRARSLRTPLTPLHDAGGSSKIIPMQFDPSSDSDDENDEFEDDGVCSSLKKFIGHLIILLLRSIVRQLIRRLISSIGLKLSEAMCRVELPGIATRTDPFGLCIVSKQIIAPKNRLQSVDVHLDSTKLLVFIASTHSDVLAASDPFMIVGPIQCQSSLLLPKHRARSRQSIGSNGEESENLFATYFATWSVLTASITMSSVQIDVLPRYLDLVPRVLEMAFSRNSPQLSANRLKRVPSLHRRQKSSSRNPLSFWNQFQAWIASSNAATVRHTFKRLPTSFHFQIHSVRMRMYRQFISQYDVDNNANTPLLPYLYAEINDITTSASLMLAPIHSTERLPLSDCPAISYFSFPNYNSASDEVGERADFQIGGYPQLDTADDEDTSVAWLSRCRLDLQLCVGNFEIGLHQTYPQILNSTQVSNDRAVLTNTKVFRLSSFRTSVASDLLCVLQNSPTGDHEYSTQSAGNRFGSPRAFTPVSPQAAPTISDSCQIHISSSVGRVESCLDLRAIEPWIVHFGSVALRFSESLRHLIHLDSSPAIMHFGRIRINYLFVVQFSIEHSELKLFGASDQDVILKSSSVPGAFPIELVHFQIRTISATVCTGLQDKFGKLRGFHSDGLQLVRQTSIVAGSENIVDQSNFNNQKFLDCFDSSCPIIPLSSSNRDLHQAECIFYHENSRLPLPGAFQSDPNWSDDVSVPRFRPSTSRFETLESIESSGSFYDVEHHVFQVEIDSLELSARVLDMQRELSSTSDECQPMQWQMSSIASCRLVKIQLELPHALRIHMPNLEVRAVPSVLDAVLPPVLHCVHQVFKSFNYDVSNSAASNSQSPQIMLQVDQWKLTIPYLFEIISPFSAPLSENTSFDAFMHQKTSTVSQRYVSSESEHLLSQSAAMLDPLASHHHEFQVSGKCLAFHIDSNFGGFKVQLRDLSVYHDSVSFLQTQMFAFQGLRHRDSAVAAPAPRMHFALDEVDLRWDPATQLGIFQMVKHWIASVVNLKALIFSHFPAAAAQSDWPPEFVVKNFQRAAQRSRKSQLSSQQYFTNLFHHFEPPASDHNILIDFLDWFHRRRAPYLSDAFQRISMSVCNIRALAFLDESAWAHISLKQMFSDMLPTRFSFIDVHISILGQPCVFVESLQLSRSGLADTDQNILAEAEALKESQRSRILAESPAFVLWNMFERDFPAPNTVATLTDPSTRARLLALDSNAFIDLNWDERQLLLADFRALNMKVSNVRIEIAYEFRVGEWVHCMAEKIDALTEAFRALPSIDRLSRRLGGPGYRGPNFPADPALNLDVRDVSFEVLDHPLEAFFVNVSHIWNDTSQERLRREEALRLKLRFDDRYPDTDKLFGQISDSRADFFSVQNPTDPLATKFRLELAEWRSLLLEATSKSFLNRVRQLQGTSRTLRSPLLHLKLAQMTMDVSYDGDYGCLRDRQTAVQTIRCLDESCPEGMAAISQSEGEHSSESRSHRVCHQADKLKIAQNVPYLLGSYVNMRFFDAEIRLRKIRHCTEPGNRPPIVKLSDASLSGVSVIAMYSTTEENSVIVPVVLQTGLSGCRPFHIVDLRRQFSPFKMYYNMSLKLQNVVLNYSPSGIESAALDLITAFHRLLPDFVDRRNAPMGFWDIARLVTHGRLQLDITNVTAVANFRSPRSSSLSSVLAASNSKSLNNECLEICSKRVQLVYQNSVIRVSALRTRVNAGLEANNDQENALLSPLISLPRADLKIQLHWQTAGGDSNMHDVYPIAAACKPCPPVLPSQFNARLEHVPSVDRPIIAPQWMYGVRLKNRSPIEQTSDSFPVEVSSLWLDSDSMLSAYLLKHKNDLHSPPDRQIKIWQDLGCSLKPVCHGNRVRVSSKDASKFRVLLAPDAVMQAIDVISQDPSSLHLLNTPIDSMPEFSLSGNSAVREESTFDVFSQFRSIALVVSVSLSLPAYVIPSLQNAQPQYSMHDWWQACDLNDDEFDVGSKGLSISIDPSRILKFALALSKVPPVFLPPRVHDMSVQSSVHNIFPIVRGLILDALKIEHLSLRVWAGQESRPCRGQRLCMDSIVVSTQIMKEHPVEVLYDLLTHDTKLGSTESHLMPQNASSDWSRSFPDVAGKAENEAQNLSPVSSPIALRSKSLASSRYAHRQLSDSSKLILWVDKVGFLTCANTTFNVSNISASIIGNEKWIEVLQQASLRASLEDDIELGKCVVVSTWENQRRVGGLLGNYSPSFLLPTDRSEWSDESGDNEMLREAQKLPSQDWVWDGPWSVDLALRKSGEVDDDGWSYALDFPREYRSRDNWTASVRRRRWIRIRRLADSAHVENSAITSHVHNEFVFSLSELKFEQRQLCRHRKFGPNARTCSCSMCNLQSGVTIRDQFKDWETYVARLHQMLPDVLFTEKQRSIGTPQQKSQTVNSGKVNATPLTSPTESPKPAHQVRTRSGSNALLSHFNIEHVPEMSDATTDSDFLLPGSKSASVKSPGNFADFEPNMMSDTVVEEFSPSSDVVLRQQLAPFVNRLFLYNLKSSMSIHIRDALLELAMEYLIIASEFFEVGLEAKVEPCISPLPIAELDDGSDLEHDQFDEMEILIPAWLTWTQKDFVSKTLGIDFSFAQSNVQSDESCGCVVIGVAHIGAELRLHWHCDSLASAGDKVLEMNLRFGDLLACVAPQDVDVNSRMSWLTCVADPSNSMMKWSSGILKRVVDPLAGMFTIQLPFVLGTRIEMQSPHVSDHSEMQLSSAPAMWRIDSTEPVPVTRVKVARFNTLKTAHNLLPIVIESETQTSRMLGCYISPVVVHFDSEKLYLLFSVLHELISSPLPRSVKALDNYSNFFGFNLLNVIMDPADADDRQTELEELGALTSDERSNPGKYLQPVRAERQQLRWKICDLERLFECVSLDLPIGLQHPVDSDKDVDSSTIDHLKSIIHDQWLYFARASLRHDAISDAYRSELRLERQQRESNEHIHNFRFCFHLAQVRCLLLSNQTLQPFMMAQFSRIDTRLEVFENLTGKFSLSVDHVLIESLVTKSPERRYVLAPLQLNGEEWRQGRHMISVTVHTKPSADTTHLLSFQHVGLDTFPLKLYVTLDLITAIIEFISVFTQRTDPESKLQRVQSMKRHFLPQNGVLSVSKLESNATISADALTPFTSTGTAPTLQPTLTFSDMLGIGSSLQTNRRFLEVAMQLYEAQKQKSASLEIADRVTSEDVVSAGADLRIAVSVDPLFYFMHVLIGSMKVSASYHGDRDIGLENFENVSIDLRPLRYQRQEWRMSTMVERLKTDFLFEVVSKLPQALGDYLGYKLGMKAESPVALSVTPTKSISRSFSSAQSSSESQGDSPGFFASLFGSGKKDKKASGRDMLLGK